MAEEDEDSEGPGFSGNSALVLVGDSDADILNPCGSPLQGIQVLKSRQVIQILNQMSFEIHLPTNQKGKSSSNHHPQTKPEERGTQRNRAIQTNPQIALVNPNSS